MTKRGRPSLYTPEIAQEICERLANGESMRRICQDEHMPHRRTVERWMGDDSDFAAKCACAREDQADYMADLVFDTAKSCTSESAQADRVKIAGFQWLAAKLSPKRYGDRVQTEHSGSIGLAELVLGSYRKDGDG